ncbi:SIR2 family protein [Pseudomonas vlassakiae]|uniref:SIR2 family protein n=1 Tax=Pseudomonas TaxID=286 RepID=UPI000C189899|nr:MULTISPECIES: SIR2 family protein [unclassified Pseudomonas]MBS3187683.1 SIR2 family protein [Pseudomonas sp. PCH44]PIK77381.1 SIR2 family protein [Pseudomonas sp. 382]
MHSLLLGNGVNRAALQKDWTQLLRELAAQFEADELIHHLGSKPLSMFIEELCARSTGVFRHTEHAVKVAFAKLLEQIKPSEAHQRICDPFKVILTTNYDFTIEETFAGPLYNPAFLYPESRYSLFRRYQAGTKDVWHVHGDSARPSSMVLGYDQYAGSLQKIRNYVTEGVKIKALDYRLSSAVKNGVIEFERNRSIYSWVDHFLRDHLHIVGLGMDFAEIDLWWLLLHKRRRTNQTGRVFYYQAGLTPSEDTAVTSLMKSLNVEVIHVIADSYTECYLRIADEIEGRIKAYPELLSLPEKCLDQDSYQTISLSNSKVKQRGFRFPVISDDPPKSF